MGSGFTPGANAGLRVAFELPATMGGAASAIVCTNVVTYDIRGATQTKPRFGVGDTVNFPTHRIIAESGSGTAMGAVTSAQAPVPDDWRGKTATMKVFYDSERYVSATVKITGFALSRDEKHANEQRANITWVNESVETYNYPDGQTNTGGTAESVSTQRQFAGTIKGYDPQGIAPPPTQTVIDWAATLDNTVNGADAAEQSEMLALIVAAAIPLTQPHNYRQRGVTFDRYAINGGTATIYWGLTDTKEDWINERTDFKIDPNKIATGGNVAAINAQPTLPTVSGQTVVSRGTTAIPINGSTTGYVTDAGQLTTADSITYPGTSSDIDNAGMASEGKATVVYDTTAGPPADATPPDGSLQVVGTEIIKINRDESQKITYFKGNRNDEQWIYDHTSQQIDPSNLKNQTIMGAVYERGSEPTTPEGGAPAGLVLNHTEYFDLVSPNTSNLEGKLWFYSETTSADDLIFEHAKTEIDPQNIKSSKINGVIFTTGGTPTDSNAPTDLKLVNKIDLPQTDAGASNQSLRLFFYGKLDSLDEIKVPKQKTTVDANHIEDDGMRTKEWLTSASPPAAPDDPPTNNVKIIAYTDTEIYPIIGSTPGLNLRTFLYGAKDSRDEAILPNFETTTDQSTLPLESTAIRAYLDGDSIPGTPSGLVLVNAKARPLTLSLGINRTLTILIYGLATAQQKKETEQLKTGIDANHINDDAVRAKLWLAAGSPPSAPDFPPTNNVKVINFHDIGVPENPLLLLRVWVYGPKDSKDDRILEKYSTTTDASTLPLTSRAFRSYLDGDALDSTILDANGKTLVAVNTVLVPVTIGLGVNRTLYVREFGFATSQQAKETEQLKTDVDGGSIVPLYLNDSDVRTKLWDTTGSPPSGPDNAPSNNVKLLAQTDVGVPENPKLNLRVWVYGAQNSADKLALGTPWLRHRYGNETDVSNLECTAIRAALVVAASNADPGSIANPNPSTVTDANGNVLVATKTYVNPQSLGLPLHDVSLVITEYALLTPKRDREFRETTAIANRLDIYRNRTASIVPWTDTEAALVASLLGTNKADPTFLQATAQLLTPHLAIQIIESTGEDKKQHSQEVDSKEWPFRGKPQAGWNVPTAFGNPNAYVFVILNGAVSGGGGLLSGYIQQTLWRRNTGSFKIRRLIPASSPADPFLHQRGTVNDAPFRGYPAHTVMYRGMEIEWNENVGGTEILFGDLCYDTDDLMFMNDGLLPEERSKVFVANTLTPLPSSNYYDPNIFNSVSGVFSLVWPAVSNFSLFGVTP